MLFFFAVCHREMRVTKKDFLMSNSPNWPTAKFSVPHVCVCVCVWQGVGKAVGNAGKLSSLLHLVGNNQK